jgi:uncharacterized protein DUF3179
MSQDAPGSPGPPGLPALNTVYWTPARLALGVLMFVTALGVVAYIQWDEIERITQTADAGEFFPHEVPATTFDFSDMQVPQNQIIRGGPPKDGIPAITDPKTAPVAYADFMKPDDRVVGVTVNGESRAYPIKVLNYHECYNDTLGGVPIAIVFCPLCDSVTVVDRRLGDKTYEFGISGLLFNSNVLLYDRQDEALWSQAGLIAISGPHAGKSLKHLAGWEITAFANWRNAQPDSTIATLDTGYYSTERYNGIAYESYFQTDEVMFPVERSDPRFINKYPVVGVLVGETAKAYPIAMIADTAGGRIEDTIEGQRIVLEATSDPPTVRVVSSPEGARVIHTFWFAWYAFHPETEVYADGGEDG